MGSPCSIIVALRRMAARAGNDRVLSSAVEITSSAAPTSTTAGSAASAANSDWL